MKEMIIVNNLSKYFRVNTQHHGKRSILRKFISHESRLVRAVDNITFRIQKGEIVGYLGPNGAGKSTTLKMLSGLLVPTRGSLEVNRRIPWKNRRQHVKDIGVVFGQRTALWWDLPAIETFEMFRYFYGIQNDKYQKNLNEFRDLLDLDKFLTMPVRSLSLGQRMRADLCAALLHDPAILFLDEPTIGLDVVAKDRIRKFIRHINHERGVTVLLTTHDISDVEKLCQRVMIIDHGKLLYDGKLSTLSERFEGKRTLLVDMAEEYGHVNIEGAEVVDQNGSRVIYQFERNKITASQLINQLSLRYQIRDLKVLEPDIEETIRRIYEEHLLIDEKF